MKKRHRKEKDVHAQTQAHSGEQHHDSGSGDDAQHIVMEEHVPVDSHEGDKKEFPPGYVFLMIMLSNFLNLTFIGYIY